MGCNRKSAMVFAVLLSMTVVSGEASADTRYVSDRLIINLRQAPDDRSETVRTLKTDTPVEVLEERDHFLRVRTAEGEQGWVQSQYVTPDLPKALVIEELEKKMRELEGSNRAYEKEQQEAERLLVATRQQLEDDVKGLSSRLNLREKELAKLREEVVRVSRDYETLRQQSTDVVRLAEERDRLRKEHEAVGSEARGLRAENEQLRREGMISWFLAGAGVFLTGWLAGKVSRRKRSYY